MPTKFAIALVGIVALFLVLTNGEGGTRTEATSPVERGLERIDSVLQRGLSEGSHDAISDGLSSSVSESEDFLSAAQASVDELSE